MSRPTAAEAWREARAEGIGPGAADRLRDGSSVEVIGPDGQRYTYRLQRLSDGWVVEGTDGVGPWEVCEGPIVDSGRPPWLARPKQISVDRS